MRVGGWVWVYRWVATLHQHPHTHPSRFFSIKECGEEAFHEIFHLEILWKRSSMWFFSLIVSLIQSSLSTLVDIYLFVEHFLFSGIALSSSNQFPFLYVIVSYISRIRVRVPYGHFGPHLREFCIAKLSWSIAVWNVRCTIDEYGWIDQIYLVVLHLFIEYLIVSRVSNRLSEHSINPLFTLHLFHVFPCKKQSINQLQQGSGILCSYGWYLLLETLIVSSSESKNRAHFFFLIEAQSTEDKEIDLFPWTSPEELY